MSHRGKVLLVLDPSDYPKRSRGRGKRGRPMQHIGRPRRKASGRPMPATTFDYVDIWAVPVLAGKPFLPLDRRLFSGAHPGLPSQPIVEDAVLARALAMLRAFRLPSIVVGDRGLGRNERLVALVDRQQSLVFRIDADITALSGPGRVALPLAELLARQPWLGETVWDQTCRSHRLRLRRPAPRLGRRLDPVISRNWSRAC